MVALCGIQLAKELGASFDTASDVVRRGKRVDRSPNVFVKACEVCDKLHSLASIFGNKVGGTDPLGDFVMGNFLNDSVV